MKKFDFLFQWSAILIALSSLVGINSFTFTELISFGKTFIAVAIFAVIIYFIPRDDEDTANESDPIRVPLLIEVPDMLQDLTINSLTEEDSQKSKITNTQSGNTSTP